jgi:hypothetical protein
MSAPLSGIRVVELASFVAAPAAGALLADLGAEVIKVEVPWGEIYRHSLPRYAGYDSDFGLAPHFHMDNRGKRSVALDLVLPQAVEALRRLVERADVLLTNVLPSRLAKFGLDPERLRVERPELIVARLSGFGPVGPEADAPAFDYSSYWARTGFMDMLHEPDAPPAFQRPGMGDHSASLALVVGVLSALRQRDSGGAGSRGPRGTGVGVGVGEIVVSSSPPQLARTAGRLRVSPAAATPRCRNSRRVHRERRLRLVRTSSPSSSAPLDLAQRDSVCQRRQAARRCWVEPYEYMMQVIQSTTRAGLASPSISTVRVRVV